MKLRSVKNAILETEHTELKEKIEELQQSDESKHAIVVKDMQKKILAPESQCIPMTALGHNEGLMKFYTGLCDHETLKAVLIFALNVCHLLLSMATVN